MTRSEAFQRLRAHEADLRGLGIDRLSLFGSTARGEEREGSDGDVERTFQYNVRIGTSVFVRMEDRIAVIARGKVDLIAEPLSDMPRLKAGIGRDRLHASDRTALAN